MQSRLDIEDFLRIELETAKSRYQRATAEFTQVSEVVRDGLSRPGGTQRIQSAALEQATAKKAFVAALGRFNDFVLRGELPDSERINENPGNRLGISQPS